MLSSAAFGVKRSVPTSSERMQLYVIFCGMLPLSAVIQPARIQQDTGVRAAAVGENVTLHCVCDTQVSMHFSWYRQPVGGRPERLSTFYKFDDTSEEVHPLKEHPRLSVLRKEGRNHLRIADVRPSDTATYYCGSSHTNVMELGEGVFLSVEGSHYLEVVQEPASEVIQPGGSVTLTCAVHPGACADGHAVYWFRRGSHQGVLRARGTRCEPASAAAAAAPPSPRRCVYHLRKRNASASDAGTYYCAVASCGELLFGSGSTLLSGEDPRAQIRILAWLAIVRTGVVLLSLVICLFVYVNKTS